MPSAGKSTSRLNPAFTTGNASVNVLVDDDGNFNGSSGSWFIPERQHPLSELEPAWPDAADRWAGEQCRDRAALGCRKLAAGLQHLYDNLLEDNLQRAGLGAEAWGENLRLSANYYQPFAGWQPRSDIREQRMARGYDVTAKAASRFHHLNTSVSFEQYFGDNVDLFNSGTGYHNPVAVNTGLNYTPFRWSPDGCP